MKTILVTGGAGFIGSNLCANLIKNNNKVICLDNFYSGKKKNLDMMLDNENFSFVEFDITNPFAFEVDEIYHLACPASPLKYQKDPVYTFKTNILGALNTLDLALSNTAKILLSSTSEVYGDPVQHPQNENYWGNVNPNGIRSCYDEGKRGAETLFCDYRRRNCARIKIARIFNCYGQNMAIDDGRCISKFIVSALKNEPITIYGDGSQTRSFCYIDDLVDGLIKLMDSSDEITGPINLGNPYEISVRDIAQLIINLTSSSSKLLYKEVPQDDPKRRKPDISLAKSLLGWKPTIMLEEGLKKTIKYFESVL